MTSSISIITFVFVNENNGRLALLDECLASVAKQNYPAYEHIIVDDGSTVDITKTVEKYPNTRLIRKEQSGILTSTKTFNMGHRAAGSDYCIYLASDDLQTEICLATLSNFLDEKPDFVAVCGGAHYLDIDNNVTEYQPNWDDTSRTDLADSLVYEGNKVSGCAVMWRNRIFDGEANFPPDITGFCSDYDLWVRMAELGLVGRTSEIVIKYRARKDSTRFKTRGDDISSHHKFDQQYFQFSKFARIRYVKNSALKRRMPPTGQFDFTPTPLGKGVDMRVGTPATKLLEVKANSSLSEKNIKSAAKYQKSHAWKPDISPYMSAVLDNAYPDWRSILEKVTNTNHCIVTLRACSPLSTLMSWIVPPSTYLIVDLTDFDRDGHTNIDFYNWAFPDFLFGEDRQELTKNLAWLGLGNTQICSSE